MLIALIKFAHVGTNDGATGYETQHHHLVTSVHHGKEEKEDVLCHTQTTLIYPQSGSSTQNPHSGHASVKRELHSLDD